MKKLTDEQQVQLRDVVTTCLKDSWGFQNKKYLHLAVDEEGKFYGSVWDAGTSVRWAEGYTPVNQVDEEDDLLLGVADIIAETEEAVNEEFNEILGDLLYEAVEEGKITEEEKDDHWSSYSMDGYTDGRPLPKHYVEGFIQWVKDHREWEASA